MKKIVALALLAAAPLFATSLRNPYDVSREVVGEILTFEPVSKELSRHFEGVKSIEEHKDHWTVKTDKHECEVKLSWVKVGEHPISHVPGAPTGPILKREYNLVRCR